ncbi:phosphoglycerol transferase MdoB-like AlkP superfamily enzyme [Methanobacterium aggregans]|nr:phosphoglycerol transferase MdoB-like AlkP superfamily enzyme [Methanobacterium aggregans]
MLYLTITVSTPFIPLLQSKDFIMPFVDIFIVIIIMLVGFEDFPLLESDEAREALLLTMLFLLIHDHVVLNVNITTSPTDRGHLWASARSKKPLYCINFSIF